VTLGHFSEADRLAGSPTSPKIGAPPPPEKPIKEGVTIVGFLHAEVRLRNMYS
jgi:hypothetical protein